MVCEARMAEPGSRGRIDQGMRRLGSRAGLRRDGIGRSAREHAQSAPAPQVRLRGDGARRLVPHAAVKRWVEGTAILVSLVAVACADSRYMRVGLEPFSSLGVP